MTTLDPTLLPALNAIEGLLERPRMDKRRLLNSLQRLDHELRTSRYPATFETPDGEEVDARDANDVARWEGMSFEQAMEDATGIPSTGPL
jgi:hypothetical protein